MKIGFLLAAALTLSIASYAQDTKTPPSTEPQTATEAAGKVASQSVVPDAAYIIGPQDVVRIDVWKEPDITRTIPVRPDGKISLPLLNDVQASGLTALQLGQNIHDGLMKYLHESASDRDGHGN